MENGELFATMSGILMTHVSSVEVLDLLMLWKQKWVPILEEELEIYG